MLREEVLKAWESLKDKVVEINFEVFAYQKCFIIVDEMSIKPTGHNKSKMLIGFDSEPNRIITNLETIKTDLSWEIHDQLSYNCNNGKILSGSMVILLWGPTIEIVD